MKTFLLIGGIGSGKTTVSALLEARGAHCIDLDEVGHDVVQLPQVVRVLAHMFGPDILDAAGKVDRVRLAKKAFDGSKNAAILNGVTHPVILETVDRKLSELEQAGCKIAIIEASAFSGPSTVPGTLAAKLTGIIAVTAGENIRVARAVARGLDEAEVRRRIALQPTNEQMRLWADFVIENDSTLENLQNEVTKVWKKL